MSSGIHQTTFLTEASDPVILGQHQTRAKHRMREPDTKRDPGTGYQRRSATTANVRRRDNTVLVTCTAMFQLRVNSTATARGTSTEDLDVRVGSYIFISPLILTVRWRTECGRRSSGRPRMHEEYSDKLSALIPRITIVIFKFSIHYLASELSPGGHVHVRQ